MIYVYAYAGAGAMLLLVLLPIMYHMTWKERGLAVLGCCLWPITLLLYVLLTALAYYVAKVDRHVYHD